MVYTMSEILEYANYDGQLAKIQTGCDLIIESAIESLAYKDSEEAYTEGVEGVVNAMISMVSAAFKAIMDFISKQVEKIDNIVNGKKYQAMMSPEMKAKFDEVTAGKDVKGIDTVELLKLSKKSEAFIDKFMSTVNGEISKAQSDPSYDTKHLKDYCKNAEDAYDKIYKEMERVGTTKKSLKKADFYAMVKAGNEINTSMKEYKKKMNSMEKQLTATIKKLNKAGYLKEFTEGDTEFRVYNEGVISSIKSGIQRVVNSIKNFLNKHARACQYVCAVLSSIALFSTTSAIGSERSQKSSYEYRRGIRDKQRTAVHDGLGKDISEWITDFVHKHPELSDAEIKAAVKKHKDDLCAAGAAVSNAGYHDKLNRDSDHDKNMKQIAAGTAGVAVGTVIGNHFKKIADENDRKKQEAEEAKKKAESKED